MSLSHRSPGSLLALARRNGFAAFSSPSGSPSCARRLPFPPIIHIHDFSSHPHIIVDPFSFSIGYSPLECVEWRSKKGWGIAVCTAYHPRLCAPVVSGPLTPSVSLDGWHWLGLNELNHCAVCLLALSMLLSGGNT